MPGTAGIDERSRMNFPIMIKFSIIPLFLFVMTRPLASSPVQWLEDADRAFHLSEKKNRPIFVHIYADWCPTCRSLEHKIYPDKRVSLTLHRFIALRINGERDPERQLADRYDITGYPTLLVIDYNGHVLARHSGGISSDDLTEMLIAAWQEKDKGKALIGEAERTGDPEDLFKAGVYYSEAKKHQTAREYFLRGWRNGNKNRLSIRLDCLFNAAVNSMELNDYTDAESEWSLYLKNASEDDSNRSRALLYRGIARKNLGQNKEAARDIQDSLKGLDKRTADAAKKLLLKLK